MKERFAINAYFNNSGVTGEDGYFRGNYTGPAWFYDKGNSVYFCLHLNNNNLTSVHLHVSTTTGAPTASQGKIV